MRSLPAWFRLVLALLGLVSLCGLARGQTVELSTAERAWMQSHPVLRLGVAREYPPYYFVPPEPARPHGFIVETIGLWAERVGLKLDIRR